MPGIYIIGAADRAKLILNWLSKKCKISSDEVSAIIEHPESMSNSGTDLLGVPIIAFDEIGSRLDDKDIVIVASQMFGETVGELFSRGLYNVFDGEAIIRRESLTQRFLSVASGFYLGPDTPATLEPDRSDFLRYASSSIEARNVPQHKLFVVNSMPKSGTIWMIAMLEGLLGVKARQQITVSHVRDIETDWPKQNNHGAVTLVRDMRDVVISWFHHLSRSDLQNGFSSPRYPYIEEFYFEHLIGQIFGNARYYSGDLGTWLNYVGAHSFPIIRYEDLVADTQSALRKVMNFWKIDIADQALEKVVRDYSFAKMRETVSGRDGYVSDMLKSGHMHLGQIGSWERELPMQVAEDINQRFADYQRRLKYI